MIEKDLKFLDFILPRLCKVYETGDTLNSLSYDYKKETGIDIPYEEIQPFEDLYNGVYFDVITNVGLIVITPEYKSIIDNYGSLSEYLDINNNTQYTTTHSEIPTTIPSRKKTILGVGIWQITIMIFFGCLTIAVMLYLAYLQGLFDTGV